jgi:hypothetical protein
MDSNDLIQMKKKLGPGSEASSIRSGKSGGYKQRVSYSHSTTSAMVRDIISHIPDKEKPQAENLTQKIKQIKELQQIEQSGSIFEELIMPYNKVKYYETYDETQIKAIEEARSKQLNRATTGIFQNAFSQPQKDLVTKTEAVSKFQTKINMMIIAFRSLKKMYFPNDLYRIIYARQWKDFDKEAIYMLGSAFLDSRIFVGKYIERLAYKELLGLETQLPRSFSKEFVEAFMSQATGLYLGGIQNKVIETLNALIRITHFRVQLLEPLHYLYNLYEEGLIFNSNLKSFITLFSELALFEDIDYTEFKLLDLYLEFMDNPVKQENTAIDIVNKQNPNILLFINFEDNESKEESKEESPYSATEKNPLSRKVSRKSSIASMSSVRRLNTRNALMASQKSLLKNFELGNSLTKPQRMEEMQKNYKEMINKRKKEKMKLILDLDIVDRQELIIQAARGMSRLMLPCNSISFINNTANAKKSIYEEILKRNLIEVFLKDPIMKSEKSEVKRCLTTIITMFVLQTSTESKYDDQFVIFYLRGLGILEHLSAWSKDPDLVVKSNSAWMFTGLCVRNLVHPLELTKQGIIRDMFVLYISLYLEPQQEPVVQEEAENIAEKILKMYDYENFLDSIGDVLNRVGKIQHLIFATLIFLSIYDDKNIISTVHKSSDEEVDKPVEENALCGLMELLQQDAEKMKLFIKILIQFTICDDDSFQQNGIWYLKHIIINSKLNQLVESQNVDILEVFIAGSVCESDMIQQECVNVLTYLAIEKKAYRENKEDPLLDALMYLTGVQFKTIRGLAYNGLAALALHGKEAASILIKQANIDDYFNTITKNLKKFRQNFIKANYNSETVAEYAGINLLLNLSRSATQNYQLQVSERIPLILDTIAAQNQLNIEENMNEVGCLQTIRALMSSTTIKIKEEQVVPFIQRVSKDKSFRISRIIINNKFVPWCLSLLIDSNTLQKTLETVELLRFVLYEFYHSMNFEQEETSIRNLFKNLLKKYKWDTKDLQAKSVHEKLVECFLIIFIREKNIILAVTDEVLQQVVLCLETFDEREADTKLALSKHFSSTANLPQVQNLLLKRIPLTIKIAQVYLGSSVYEEKFNITKLLSYLTRSPEFNAAVYEVGMFETLCDAVTVLEAQDSMALVNSITNLLVYSRIKGTINQCENFLIKGYFSSLLKLTKDNDCHSLTEAFLDLFTKLLVEKDFSDKLFSDKNYRIKDIISVLIRAVDHECKERCKDMSSHDYKFSVNVYSITWLVLKKYAFNVASQLIRLGKCYSKLKKYNVGESALKCFIKARKSLQSRRTVDPLCENLLCELCIYLQLHYGLLKDETLSDQLLSQSQMMASIMSHDKISELLQARVGALLLHSSLIAPITNDASKLSSRIDNILFSMTNTTLPELHNLAVWSLRQLYLKSANTKPAFDYQDLFLKAKSVKNVVPKLFEHHRPLQENALLCLGDLFEFSEMKEEFLELKATDQFMFLGFSALRALTSDKAKEDDYTMLSAFGFSLKMLIKNHPETQLNLIKQHDIISSSLQILEQTSQLQTEISIKICENFTEVIKNLLENYELHSVFLSTQSNTPNLQLLQSMIHNSEVPTYEQLKIDNNIVHCFSLLADNPDLKFYENTRMVEFTGFIRQINDLYEKGQYLSKTEVDTHFTILKTLKKLIETRASRLGENPTDDEREDFLQELNSLGGLDPLLFYEFSNVPDIREMAGNTLDMLAPAN